MVRKKQYKRASRNKRPVQGFPANPDGNIFDLGGPVEVGPQNVIDRAPNPGPLIGATLPSIPASPVGGANFATKFNNFAGSSGAAGAAISAAATAVGGLAKNGISGGLNSGVGNGIASLGDTAGSVVGAFNPLLGAAVKVGSGIIGGATNALFGTKVNQAELDKANAIGNYYKGIDGNVASFNDVKSLTAQSTFKNPYASGLLNKGWAKKRNAFLHDDINEAHAQAIRNQAAGVDNLKSQQMDSALGNYAAFGGPLNMMSGSGGAVDYGFTSDYLTMKNDQTRAKSSAEPFMSGLFGANSAPMFALGGGIHIKKENEGTFTEAAQRAGMGVQEFASHVLANKDSYSPLTVKRANFARNFGKRKHSKGGNLILGANGDTLFALGGDLQTNGTDFTTGLSHIDAGGSHEENPYQGVQMGVAPDGSPNLVEEGETIDTARDYVFSDRTLLDKDALARMHFGKNSKISFASASKRLEREAAERPNDPMSKAALNNMLLMLQEEQERQRQEEEARSMEEAFNSLSPEEQQAVLQQMAQQQGAQEASQEEQPEEQEGSPEEEQQMQEQQAQEEQMQAQQQQTPEGFGEPAGTTEAFGGRLHKFAKGGGMKTLLANGTYHTASDLDKAAKEKLSATEYKQWKAIDWDDFIDHPGKRDYTLLKKVDPFMSDAMEGGYDFGKYQPENGGYALAPFNEKLDKYTASKKQGNTKGKYQPDEHFLENEYGSKYKTTRDLEASPEYKAYTDKMVDVAKAAQGKKFTVDDKGNLVDVDGQKFGDIALLNTMRRTALGTSTSDKGEPVPLFIKNSDGTLSIAPNAVEQLVGADGKSGYRYDGLNGIFHYTPGLTELPNTVINKVRNPDGTIETIYGDVPAELGKVVKTYNWNTKDGKQTINYYVRPDDKNNKVEANVKPLEPKDDSLRYASLIGPGIGLGLQAMGFGKPDFGKLDASMNYARNANRQAAPTFIGDYIQLKPMDVWAQQNRNAAAYRATDRALMNSGLPVSTRNASRVANTYNETLNNGELGIKALTLNNDIGLKQGEYNKATNVYNSTEANKMALANADAWNKNAQWAATMNADIAKERLNDMASWYGGIYGNIGNMFNNLGALGKENAQWNLAAALANNGAFGNPSNYMRGYSGRKEDAYTEEQDTKQPVKTAARGGRLHRRKKRGLTI